MAPPLAFRYPLWHPWSSVPGTILLGTVLILWAVFIRYPGTVDQVIGYWLILGFLTAMLLVGIRQLALDIVRPQTIMASDEGVVGLRLAGRPIRINWDEIGDVAQRTEGIRYIGLRRLTLQIRTSSGDRTLTVDSRLQGYSDLVHLVLERTGRANSTGRSSL